MTQNDFYFISHQGDESEWALLLAATAACEALCRCNRVPLGGHATAAECAGESQEAAVNAE